MPPVRWKMGEIHSTSLQGGVLSLADAGLFPVEMGEGRNRQAAIPRVAARCILWRFLSSP